MAKKERKEKGEKVDETGAPSRPSSSSADRPRKKKKRRVEDDAPKATESEATESEAIDSDPTDAEASEDDAVSPADGDDALAARGSEDLAGDAEADEDEEEDLAAAQLGIEKYVLAGFFAGGILVAFLTGRILHLIWSQLSNRDWFARALPDAAAVNDDAKLTYGTVVGAAVALVVVIRCYRSQKVRAWTDEVAGELAKVKWPTQKEVTSHTLTVLAASAIATTYLALLDRLWGFVTNLVYGTGT